MNSYIFFMLNMTQWSVAGQKARVSEIPPSLGSTNPDLFQFSQLPLFVSMALQIIFYFAFAPFVEWAMHGISFQCRKLATATTAGKPSSLPVSHSPDSPTAVALHLKKSFYPGLFRKVFCWGERKQPKMAMEDVTLETHRGQITCLVGQNGSGKTAALRMMAGFTSMDADEISFDTLPSQIGICPQQNGSNETDEQIDQLIDDCDLLQKTDCLAQDLSGGQKRKLQLACTFIGGSSVCLVDECTSDLDPLSRQAVWDLLLRSRANRSIILTTHFLDEVDVPADHIVVLSKGKVVCKGTPVELNSTYGGGYRVVVERTEKTMAALAALKPTVSRDTLVFQVVDSNAAANLSKILEQAGVLGLRTGPCEESYENLIP
ncbi:hypothetical protein VHEMI04420 [[Torrubiella] hemipterigena]|uniref:ABC transporter domain-containing protein n=1 Tax=[Torrubiella] hemipterigena TaxID=1531966 RepID=A0A0A1T166_9HYPO|nr:hypothetical protein VHEMI04420 [[Torrubiella] hemipterigena]